MATDLQKSATIFKSFCDENRLKILQLLSSGEKCACSLLEELHITQPTLSHHMKILCDAGIVDGRKDGKWTHYSVNKNGIEQAQIFLNSFVIPESQTAKDTSCCD